MDHLAQVNAFLFIDLIAKVIEGLMCGVFIARSYLCDR